MTVVVPCTPSAVAVMVAVPRPAAVTSPVLSTVAIELSLDNQVTVRPLSVVPLPFFAVAVSCSVVGVTTPVNETEESAGVTVTVATGSVTVTAVALLLVTVSLVAVIEVLPADTAVTTPVELTVATA